MSSHKALQRFRNWSRVTIAAVYVLILVGGIVRASGAGMGCPDWPLCFGKWVPPLVESELPSNYQDIYRDRGYADTRFNAVKTWTEYINRLVGAVIGVLIVGTFVTSISVRRQYPRLMGLSFLAVCLVFFQAWLGGQVVASNLETSMITLHMLAAVLLLGVLIAASTTGKTLLSSRLDSIKSPFRKGVWLVFGVSLIQLLIGTQIREEIDVIAKANAYAHRSTWLSELSALFNWHQLMVFVVLTGVSWVVLMLISYAKECDELNQLRYQLVGVLLATMAVGVSMSLVGVLPIFQPLHLLFSVLLLGTLMSIAFRLRS